MWAAFEGPVPLRCAAGPDRARSAAPRARQTAAPRAHHRPGPRGPRRLSTVNARRLIVRLAPGQADGPLTTGYDLLRALPGPAPPADPSA